MPIQVIVFPFMALLSRLDDAPSRPHYAGTGVVHSGIVLTTAGSRGAGRQPRPRGRVFGLLKVSGGLEAAVKRKEGLAGPSSRTPWLPRPDNVLTDGYQRMRRTMPDSERGGWTTIAHLSRGRHWE